MQTLIRSLFLNCTSNSPYRTPCSWESWLSGATYKQVTENQDLSREDNVRCNEWPGVETLSALLVFCEENRAINHRVPSQRASNMELWCYLCKLDQVAEQTVEWPLIRDTITYVTIIMETNWHSDNSRFKWLIYWGLVTPYGDTDLGHQWLR